MPAPCRRPSWLPMGHVRTGVAVRPDLHSCVADCGQLPAESNSRPENDATRRRRLRCQHHDQRGQCVKRQPNARDAG
jgi:hypothetical protein